LPGFNLTLGYTLLYLSLIVLIPLSALVLKTFTLSWDQFWAAISSPRVLASYRLTFGASLIAALVNVVFGLLVAWVLVRYSFPGKKVVDALVDLPFALPTAVAGISSRRCWRATAGSASIWSRWASSWLSTLTAW
jgi:sulfate transport system permease protein